MKTSATLKYAATLFVMGTVLTGYSEPNAGSPVASASSAKADRIAAKAAVKARAAMAKKKFDVAISLAETAVASNLRNASYRMLLAQAYLGAGRFVSAETSFADVLTLSPDQGRAALNLALVQVARDKKDQALVTLKEYRDRIAGVDFGLALALAGDTKEGVRVLELLAREPGVDARVRQNLAFSYALDGQWAPARAMAATDLGETAADARLLEWAAFARPGGAQAQVASLLGISPVSDDRGQPLRLALKERAEQSAMAASAPIPSPTASADVPAAMPTADATLPVFETGAASASVAPAVEVDTAAGSADVPLIRAAGAPSRQTAAAGRSSVATLPKPRRFEAGKFVVQLGAYANAAVSHDAWQRLAPRYGLRGFEPANASARVGRTSVIRLSVGGFASRAEGMRICARIKTAGGKCFVRGLLGDQLAVWAKKGPVTRVAMTGKKATKPARLASR